MWSQKLGKTMPDSHKVIAVVDDDPEMRAAMASLLSAYGYGAETFDQRSNLSPALQRAKQPVWSWIFSLATSQGVELAHQLAADGFTYPIIFMTGLDDEVFAIRRPPQAGSLFFANRFPPKRCSMPSKRLPASRCGVRHPLAVSRYPPSIVDCGGLFGARASFIQKRAR